EPNGSSGARGHLIRARRGRCATASPARRSLGSFLRLDELSATRSVSGDLAGPKYWRTLAGAGHQATLECCGCRSDPAGRAVPAPVVGDAVQPIGHLPVRAADAMHARPTPSPPT